MRVERLLLVLLLVLLPTQLGFHWWPEWAVVLGRRVDYLSPTLYLTDVILVLLLVVYLFNTRLLNKVSLTGGKHLWSWLAALVLGFGLIVVNIFLARIPEVAFFRWLKITEMISFGWYLVQRKVPMVWVWRWLGVAAVWSFLLAGLQLGKQGSAGGWWWILGERSFSVTSPGIARANICGVWWGCVEVLRVYATFPHPNALGGFMSLITVTSFDQALRAPADKRRFWWFLLAIAGLGLIASLSRSAVVITLAMSILIWSRGRGLSVFVLGVMVLVVTWWLWPLGASESWSVRQSLNDSAISMWKSAPVFGVGGGNFLAALPHFLVARQVYYLQPVHNVFLLVLTELGLVGLGVWLWVLFYIGKHLRKIDSRLIVFLGVLVLMFIDHYWWTLQQGQLLTVLVFVLPFTPSNRST